LFNFNIKSHNCDFFFKENGDWGIVSGTNKKNWLTEETTENQVEAVVSN